MHQTQQTPKHTKNGSSKTNTAKDKDKRNAQGIKGAPKTVDPEDPMGLKAAAAVLEAEPRGSIVEQALQPDLDDDDLDDETDVLDIQGLDEEPDLYEHEELSKEKPAKTLNELESKCNYALINGIDHFYATEKVIKFLIKKVPDQKYILYKGVRVYLTGASPEKILKKEGVTVTQKLFQNGM